MLDGLRGAMGRMFARKVAPERYIDYRFVPFGNATFRLSAPEDALKVATAWRCVSLISETIAALEWEVKRRNADGTSQSGVGGDVQWLLNNEPNREMGAFDLRRTLGSHMLTYGNGYAEIQRDGRGRATALWPIGPDRIEPQRDEYGTLYYRVSNPQGGFAALPAGDVYHIKRLGWDGIKGYSVMEVAAGTLRAAAEMDSFAGSYFANGMQPSGVISVPREVKLSPEGKKMLEADFRARHQGPNKAGTPLILDGGMTYSHASSTPEQGQFLDTRKFTVYDVCRWFGVPPYLAFASDQQPRANVETQSREFYSYGLLPHIKSWEQEANRKLLSREFGGLYSQMNTDELLRGDYTTLAAYYQTMRQIGVFTVNDVLRQEGMDTIGPEGDVRVMQSQNVPIPGAGSDAPADPPDDTPDDNPDDPEDQDMTA